MKQFLKDNITLVAAIALPALLAAIFMIASFFAHVSVEDPKNDFLVTTNYYDSNSMFSFSVNNDKLTISYHAPVKDEHGGGYVQYGQKPRLWRVHVPDMAVEEIALNEPENKSARDISIPGITDIKVQNLTPGPDGYSYVNDYNYGDNIMTEIFARDNYDRGRISGIAKKSRLASFKIPDPNSYYSSQFIGWIVK